MTRRRFVSTALYTVGAGSTTSFGEGGGPPPPDWLELKQLGLDLLAEIFRPSPKSPERDYLLEATRDEEVKLKGKLERKGLTFRISYAELTTHKNQFFEKDGTKPVVLVYVRIIHHTDLDAELQIGWIAGSDSSERRRVKVEKHGGKWQAIENTRVSGA